MLVPDLCYNWFREHNWDYLTTHVHCEDLVFQSLRNIGLLLGLHMHSVWDPDDIHDYNTLQDIQS